MLMLTVIVHLSPPPPSALLGEQFLESTASQLTYHGLCELNTTVKEGELCVFFRNNHFSTLFKRKVTYGSLASLPRPYLTPSLPPSLPPPSLPPSLSPSLPPSLPSSLPPSQGQLLLLVTDHGFVNEYGHVWQTLSDIDGDGDFMDAQVLGNCFING